MAAIDDNSLLKEMMRSISFKIEPLTLKAQNQSVANRSVRDGTESRGFAKSMSIDPIA